MLPKTEHPCTDVTPLAIWAPEPRPKLWCEHTCGVNIPVRSQLSSVQLQQLRGKAILLERSWSTLCMPETAGSVTEFWILGDFPTSTDYFFSLSPSLVRGRQTSTGEAHLMPHLQVFSFLHLRVWVSHKHSCSLGTSMMLGCVMEYHVPPRQQHPQLCPTWLLGGGGRH